MSGFDKRNFLGNAAITYYDDIASQYDRIQEQKQSNKIVRERVRERFLSRVKGKTVLDFGGGTGADLQWLVSNGFRIYFCEPSEKMRARAIHLNEEKIKSQRVIFLKQDETDFMEWKTNNPLPEKVDAVLANFAVLNNIEDIQSLFEILSMLLKPEGVIIATILQPGFLKFNRKGFLKTLLPRLKKERIKLPGKGSSEGFTYIYPVSQIQKSAHSFFIISVKEKLSDSDFLYLEFTRTNGSSG